MTLKESLMMFCDGYKSCNDCPLGSICEKFHNEDDPCETLMEYSDDFIKVIAYDARKLAEKILFHLNLCEERDEPGSF